MFDLNKVFEDFVTVALSEAMAQYGGEMRSQHRDWLDHDCGIQIIPDLTWWSGGECMGIVDAKFKALETKGVPNADAYQMLAYCTALDVPRGFLVYARDPANAPMQHLVRNSGSVICVRTLDLEQAPEVVLIRYGSCPRKSLTQRHSSFPPSFGVWNPNSSSRATTIGHLAGRPTPLSFCESGG